MPTWGEVFINSFQNSWFQIAQFLPRLLGAVIILIIGWLIAKGLEFLVSKLLQYSRIDHFFERTGIRNEFLKFGMGITFSQLVAKIVKWFVIIITLIAVVDALGIPQVSAFLNSLVLYLPNVLAAIIIFAIGLILGRFIKNIIEKPSEAMKMSESSAKALGLVAKWAIIIFSAMAALVQLNIAAGMIQILFTGIVIALAIAGGLAFGLGGKDKAAEFINKISNKKTAGMSQGNSEKNTGSNRSGEENK